MWAWQESNLRPADYESNALTPELQALFTKDGKYNFSVRICKMIAHLTVHLQHDFRRLSHRHHPV
jgi:hypothetical protein